MICRMAAGSHVQRTMRRGGDGEEGVGAEVGEGRVREGVDGGEDEEAVLRGRVGLVRVDGRGWRGGEEGGMGKRGGEVREP